MSGSPRSSRTREVGSLSLPSGSGALGAIVVVWALAGALSLGLGWDTPVQSNSSSYDSLLYVQMAEALMAGEPLPYDAKTLVRLPGYPALLAANGLLGWRLHLTQQALHLASVLALLIALHGVGLPLRFNLLLGAFCCLHPALFYQSTIVYSEGLSTPALTTSVAALIGLLAAAARRRSVAAWGWCGVLAVAFAVLWNTRPDAITVIPSIGFVAVVVLLGGWQTSWRNRTAAAALFVVPLVAAYGLGRVVVARNFEHYGTPVRSELEEPNFTGAFDLLTRLAPESRVPRVPISRAALALAYRHSPSFALLRDPLSRQRKGTGFTRQGCRFYDTCDEFVGGVAFIAIRHAATQAGMHESAATASAFYRRVERELRSACDAGAVPCSGNRSGTLYSPPLRVSDLPRIGAATARVGRQWLTLGGFDRSLAGLAALPAPEAATLELYQRVTHDIEGSWHYWLGAGLRRPYVLLFAALQWLLLPLTALAVTRWWRSRKDPSVDTGAFEPLVAASGCLVLLLAAHLALVGFLDAMGLTFRTRFLSPLYPTTLALLACVAAQAFRFRGSAGAPRPSAKLAGR